MMTDTTRPYQYCKSSETMFVKTLLQLIGHAVNAVNPCRELSIPAGSAIHPNGQIRRNQAMQLTVSNGGAGMRATWMGGAERVSSPGGMRMEPAGAVRHGRSSDSCERAGARRESIKPVVYASRICHRASNLRAGRSGLAAAVDSVTRLPHRSGCGSCYGLPVRSILVTR